MMACLSPSGLPAVKTAPSSLRTARQCSLIPLISYGSPQWWRNSDNGVIT